MVLGIWFTCERIHVCDPMGMFGGGGHRDLARSNEAWNDTCQRVVEGVFEILKAYSEEITKTPWDEAKVTPLPVASKAFFQAQTSAQDMFERMFSMKFLPPGRGLWAMGTPIIRKKGLGAALNNCAFCSTEYIAKDPAQPFTFLMDACMLGVGVGFDTAGAGTLTIGTPVQPETTYETPPVHAMWRVIQVRH